MPKTSKRGKPSPTRRVNQSLARACVRQMAGHGTKLEADAKRALFRFVLHWLNSASRAQHTIAQYTGASGARTANTRGLLQLRAPSVLEATLMTYERHLARLEKHAPASTEE